MHNNGYNDNNSTLKFKSNYNYEGSKVIALTPSNVMGSDRTK